MGITVGALHFEHPISQFQDGDIKSTSTEVEHSDLHIAVTLVEAVSQSSCGGFVDDPLHGQTGYFARFFGSLTLAVIEVCRYGNDRFGHFGAEVIFGGLFHFLQHHGADLLRRIEPVADLHPGSVIIATHHFITCHSGFVGHLAEAMSHETLDGRNGLRGVGNGLTLGRVTHFALTVGQKGYDGRSGAPTFIIGYDDGFITLHHGHTGVGCS